MFKKRGKRAQFFLIAAVVIIVVVVSVITVSNYTQPKSDVKLYDLGTELGIESQNVLDYGTYSQLNESQMTTLMETFIKNYHDYTGGDKNIYFIFGNSQKISVIGYQDIANESVCITLNPSSYYGYGSSSNECANYTAIGTTQEFPADGQAITKVVITIASIDYQFKLKQGENFYFVIWQEVGGEKHVVTS
jgi:hypothetical protein